MKLCCTDLVTPVPHLQGSYFNLTQEWLVRHKYPPGPIHLTRTHLPTLPIYYSVGNFKVGSTGLAAGCECRRIFLYDSCFAPSWHLAHGSAKPVLK